MSAKLLARVGLSLAAPLAASLAALALASGAAFAKITIAIGGAGCLCYLPTVLAKDKGDKLADLAGKTFASSGPGALPDQLPRMVMRKYGIDESTARFVQVGGHAARLQAVIGGRADSAFCAVRPPGSADVT